MSFKADKHTQFAVLGLGNFGHSTALTLAENGYSVMVCDKNKVAVNEIADFVTYAIQGDILDETVLDELSLETYDVVIIGFGSSFEAAVTASIVAKEAGVPYVIAKAGDPIQKMVLEKVGTDMVVLPEKEMGQKIALQLIFNNPMEQIHIAKNCDIMDISPEKEWLGKSIIDLDLRNQNNINVLAIVRDDIAITNFSPEDNILSGDRLIILKNLDEEKGKK